MIPLSVTTHQCPQLDLYSKDYAEQESDPQDFDSQEYDSEDSDSSESDSDVEKIEAV